MSQFTEKLGTSFTSTGYMSRQIRPFLKRMIFSLFACFILTTYVIPLAYMFFTSVQNNAMRTDPYNSVILPEARQKYEYDGRPRDLYQVTIEGESRTLALAKKGRENSQFIDPNNPEAGLIEWEGRWRTLSPVYELDPQWDNFTAATEKGKFAMGFRTTAILLFFGLTGTVLSSVAVAYGFARFHIPGEKIIFAILIGTLFIPRDLLAIPLLRFYSEIGWFGTMLPLIVPQFFANALYVFLLRQYFRTLPRDLDEAAMIDGASPFRILRSIILPQSVPIVITVILLQFFFIWKDFYQPLLYMPTRQDLVPIALSVGRVASGMGADVTEIMAAALIVLVIPALVFLVLHRYILRAASVLTSK